MFSRALHLEWEILQRVEPRFAAEVEKQVDIYLANKPPGSALTSSAPARTP